MVNFSWRKLLALIDPHLCAVKKSKHCIYHIFDGVESICWDLFFVCWLTHMWQANSNTSGKLDHQEQTWSVFIKRLLHTLPLLWHWQMWRSFTEDVTMFKWGPSHSIMEVVHIWDVDVGRTPAPIYWDFVSTSIQFIEFLWGHSSGGLRRAVSGPISGRLGQSHLIGSLLYPPALLSQCELCKWNIIIPRTPSS